MEGHPALFLGRCPDLRRKSVSRIAQARIATMKSITAAFLITGVLVGLAACGGGDDAPAPTPSPPPAPPPAGTVIGPTGGTVTGPSGTSVVIPAGALASNTTINIAASSPGTPALPGSFTA